VSLWVWTVIAAFILGTALYVAAEFAAVSVRRSRVRRMAEDGNFFARKMLPFVDTPAALDHYVAVSQIGITLSSLILGAFAQATIAVALAPWLVSAAGFEPEAALSTAAISVLVGLTILQVVIGELVPKSLALQFSTQVALATVMPMRWSLVIFRPFIALLNGSANGLLRLLGVHTSAHRHVHSPDEIELLIAESRDGGLLEPDEQRRLHRALKLNLRSAKDLMIPRDRLTMLRVDTPWQDVVRTVATSPFSRLPVFRGVPERVVGMLRVKDLVTQFVNDSARSPLERLIRPIERIRHDLPADQVLSELRARRAHQAVVVDEGDRVIGLITIQDVLGAFLEVSPTPLAEAPS
jgi:CBS domain containing-hemolysin-like protein